MTTEKEDTRDLYIRTPLEEFKAFSRHRIEILEKFKDVEKLKLYMDAFELGVRKLNDVMAPGPVTVDTTDLLAEEAPPFFEEETAAQETRTPDEEPAGNETPYKDSEEGCAGAQSQEPDVEAQEPDSQTPEPGEDPPREASSDGDDDPNDPQTLRILETEYFKSKETLPVPEEAESDQDSPDTKDSSGEDHSPSDSGDLDESYEEPMTEILKESVIAEFRGEDGKKRDVSENEDREEEDGKKRDVSESEDGEEESEKS
jgi:hypothetical protein